MGFASSFRSAIFGLMASMALLVAAPAAATTVNAESVIYFDANNNIIGQQIIDCSNYTAHGGNVDSSNPYKLQEQFRCSSTIGVYCTAGGQNSLPVCTGIIDTDQYSEHFLSATGATYQEYCASTGVEFSGHPACGTPTEHGISPVYALTPYLPGWE